MQLDLYLAETARIAHTQTALLDEASGRLQAREKLTPLEESGVLHALQVLIENAIGKAKHTVKANGEAVPVSAYEAFATLERLGALGATSLSEWNAIIGLRNRIVHDYMNVDQATIHTLLEKQTYRLVTQFLLDPILVTNPPNPSVSDS